MDGVAVLRTVLVADATVTGIVPAGNIKAGDLPQGVSLPAISIKSISRVDRNIPSPGVYRHVTERVQVTVLASTYPQQKAVMRAIRAAAADTFPVINGLTRVTVHTDSAGPDLMDENASIFGEAQDYRVTYSEER